MKRCFVIQPFDDGGVFDKRFDDTFKPAIEAAGYEPYRVDKDPQVLIPIHTIENEIKNSTMCFAEITEDNPNVWYELGFAFACNKIVIMVCSDKSKRPKYPFDIHHRSVIKYSTDNPSDFVKLQSEITRKIQAIGKVNDTTDKLKSTPIADNHGLKSHEISLLIFAMELTYEVELIPYDMILEAMCNMGYNKLATNTGLANLIGKNFMTQGSETYRSPHDEYPHEYTGYCITNMGKQWIIENQGQFEFKINNIPS